MGGKSDPKDRTVHAVVESETHPPVEIVRYNLGGKWYWEGAEGRGLMTLADAVEMAVDAHEEPGSTLTWNQFRPGGAAFDRRLAAALVEKAP